MLRYDELTLNDVDYYWRNSILLFKRGGKYIPCYIYQIAKGNTYPIQINECNKGTRLVNLKLGTFIEKLLIHYPPLGYADMVGIPMYLSVRAGAGIAKGIDRNLISVRTPIAIGGYLHKELKAITDKINSMISPTSKRKAPASLVAKYHKLSRVVSRWGRDTKNSELNPTGKQMYAVLDRCVNNMYLPIDDAIASLDDEEVLGVSIAKELALFKDTSATKGNVSLYHGLNYIGEVELKTRKTVYHKDVCKDYRDCADSIISKLKE